MQVGNIYEYLAKMRANFIVKTQQSPTKKPHKNQKAWGGIVQSPSKADIKT